MKRVFLVAAVAALPFAAACGQVGDREAVAQEMPADQEDVRAQVDITVLSVGRCISVERIEYCPDEVGETRMPLPDEGYFEIEVGGEVYELARDFEGDRLEEVFVIAHSTIIIGVYKGKEVMAARKVCDCVECPNGTIVCSCPPRCPGS